jgi:hypothetical protein
MASALSVTATSAVVDRPVVAAPVPATVRTPATTPGALGRPDTLTMSVDKGNIKAQLAPIFAMIDQAGYPEITQRLRHAHFILTDGKSFGVEYYAAAMGLGIVAFSRDAFKTLTPKELASVLIHEGTHLGQGAGLKLFSGLKSHGGRELKDNLAEKEAYLKQWEAMGPLGLKNGEIYWTCLEGLHDMGIYPDVAPQPALPVHLAKYTP